MKTKYEIGDDAWIYIRDHEGERTKGKVVAVLDLPGWGGLNYVIEIETSMDPLLEVRAPGLAMLDHP